MKKSGYRKVLAALLALLLAVPGSWAAFATETEPVYVPDNEGRNSVNVEGIEVTDDWNALSVSTDGRDATAVVNGDVILNTDVNWPTAIEMISWGNATAEATINGDVVVTGTGDYGEMLGIRMVTNGESVVYIYGDLVLTAEDLAAMGIMTESQGPALMTSGGGENETLEEEENAVGATGSVTVDGNMIVTSENNEATGINTVDYGDPADLHVDIGGNLEVSGTHGTGIIAINNNENEASEKNFTVGGSVDVTGTAGGAAGIILQGNQTVTVNITGDLTATGNPDPQSTDHSYDSAVGVVATGGDNTVSIGENVNVTGEGNSMGILGAGGNNTLTIGGDVTAEGGSAVIGVGAGTSENETAEISVGGSVSAVSTGTESGSQAIGLGVDGNGTAMVDITGDVTATTQGEQSEVTGVMTQGSGGTTLNIGGGVAASGDFATGVEVNNSEKTSEGDEGTRDVGSVAVNITGDVTVDGNLNAKGVYAEIYGEDLTVGIGGAVNATAEGDDEHGSVSGLNLVVTDGSVTATVGEGITAESGAANAGGIVVDARGGSTVDVTVENGGVTANGAEDYYNAGVDVWNEGAQVQVDVTGNVESNGTGIAAYGDSPSAENPAVTSVHVDGNVTSTGADGDGIYAGVSDTVNEHDVPVYKKSDTEQTYEGEMKPTPDMEPVYTTTESNTADGSESVEVRVYYDPDTDTYFDNFHRIWERTEETETIRMENNSQVEILVEGDVTAENNAVWIDADTTVGTVDLTVDGTVSGGEHSIVLSNEANPDQVSITVWEVKPNDAGALVERAEVNRDTGDTVYTQDTEAEKQIQYIIRIAQPEYISTEGTTDQDGYQVAHEGDTVFVKLNIPEGYTLDSVWRDVGQSLAVVQNEKGEYYLAVPRGGGVELSVTLREIAKEEEQEEQNDAPRMLTITMDPNGGMINGKEGVLLIAAYDGRIFTLPAAPEKEDAEFLGWFATPYAKEDTRWAEPAADSKELKQAGQKDKITHNVFYTAIWGEPAAEEAGEAAPAEAGEADVTEPEAAETEAAGSEATEPEAEGGAEG